MSTVPEEQQEIEAPTATPTAADQAAPEAPATEEAPTAPPATTPLLEEAAPEQEVDFVELGAGQPDPPTGPTLRSFPEARPCNLLVHEGAFKMYQRIFPDGVSLEGLSEGPPDAASIEFVHDTALHVGGIEKLQSTGDFLQTPPIPLYHAHVLWSYTLRLTRRKDAKCALSLVSIGPHLGIDNSEKKGALGRNEPAGLCMPRVLAASLGLLGEERDSQDRRMEKERLELSPDRGGSLSAAKQFDLEEVPALAGGDVLRVRVRVVVGRAYFDLAKLVDLKAPTGASTTEGILASILRGERPPGADWAITVAESDKGGPTLFHVHRAAFASASDVFKVAFQTGHSYEDQIMMCTGETRCIVRALTSEDMRVVIPLVYGLFAPLPDGWRRVSTLGRNLCRLFKPELIRGVVFPQWERAICEQALAIDTADHAAAFRECLRLATIVWSCPYGALPTAKRVVIGVMADVAHLRGLYDGAEGLPKYLHETLSSISAEELLNTVHAEPIVHSLCAHYTMVASVRKTGLVATDAEWK